MKHKIIGVVICTLLIVNVMAVLALPEEQVNIIEKTTSVSHLENGSLYGRFAGSNLAPNPSFEEGNTMPTGWTYSINDTSKFHWDSNDSHSGEKSIGALNYSNDTMWSGWITTDFIQVDFVGKTYEFSGWYKFIGIMAVPPSAVFDIEMYDENYTYLGGNGFGSDFSSEWRYRIWNTSGMGGSIVNETRYIKLLLTQHYYSHTQPDPLIEVRFDDVYFGYGNTPPDTPTITGKTKGHIQKSYDYTMQTIDPDNDSLQYFIDWGDNTSNVTGLYASGETAIVSHQWNTKGVYHIKVKAIDENYAESNWANLTVTMPYSYNNRVLPADDFGLHSVIFASWDPNATSEPLAINFPYTVPINISYSVAKGLLGQLILCYCIFTYQYINVTVETGDIPSWCTAYLTTSQLRFPIDGSTTTQSTALIVSVDENAPGLEPFPVTINVSVNTLMGPFGFLPFVHGTRQNFTLYFEAAYLPLINVTPEQQSIETTPGSMVVDPIAVENIGNAKTLVDIQIINVPENWLLVIDPPQLILDRYETKNTNLTIFTPLDFYGYVTIHLWFTPRSYFHPEYEGTPVDISIRVEVTL